MLVDVPKKGPPPSDWTEEDKADRDELWSYICRRFVVMRAHEGAKALSVVRRLIECLEEESEALYRTANLLERRSILDVQPGQRTFDSLRRRIAGEFPENPVADYWLDEIRRQMHTDPKKPTPNTQTPAAYRWQAMHVANAVDLAKDFSDYYLDEMEARRKTPRGRAPSVAIAHLLETARKNGCQSNAELAKILDRWGVETDGLGSVELRRSKRWEIIIKSWRYRWE